MYRCLHFCGNDICIFGVNAVCRFYITDHCGVHGDLEGIKIKCRYNPDTDGFKTSDGLTIKPFYQFLDSI